MKKKLSTVYTVMAVIALCLYEGMIALAFAAAPRAKAAIDPNDANFINIGEIHSLYESNSTANVQALYNAISGESNTTLADITELAATADGYNAAAMRAHNDNKDIRVTFGGMIWNVVYLSETNEASPRPILTLWLADGQGVPKSTWSSGWYNDYINDPYSTSTIYPSNLYSTSYIRAVALNNGGQYAKTEDDHTGSVNSNCVVMSDSVTPATDHIFAQYTVASADNAVVNDDEIVTPALVDWQKTGQDSRTMGFHYRFPNENWDDSATFASDWYDARMNYGATDNRCYGVYANWNTDNLWLPSLTETGYKNSNPGLWGLSINQRRGDDYSWLRSGTNSYAGGASSLSASGMGYYNGNANAALVVRPAIHINLNSVSLAATPADSADPADPVKPDKPVIGGTGNADKPKDKNDLAWLLWALGGAAAIGGFTGLFCVAAKRSRQKVDVEFTKKV